MGAGSTYHLSPQHFAEVLTALRVEGEGKGHERRQVTRIDVQAPMQVAPFVNGVPGDEKTVLTRDVSIGGVGLLHCGALAMGQLLALRLPRALKKPPLLMLCRVTHCRKLADELFGIGAEFQQELRNDTSDHTAEINSLRRKILA